MTGDRMVPAEALQTTDDGHFRRSLALPVLQNPMAADVAGPSGAGRYERSGWL